MTQLAAAPAVMVPPSTTLTKSRRSVRSKIIAASYHAVPQAGAEANYENPSLSYAQCRSKIAHDRITAPCHRARHHRCIYIGWLDQRGHRARSSNSRHGLAGTCHASCTSCSPTDCTVVSDEPDATAAAGDCWTDVAPPCHHATWRRHWVNRRSDLVRWSYGSYSDCGTRSCFDALRRLGPYGYTNCCTQKNGEIFGSDSGTYYGFDYISDRRFCGARCTLSTSIRSRQG